MCTIRIVKRQDIDPRQWDILLEQSHFAHPCLRSAYLDIVCPDWCALVMGDWDAAVPVATKRKFGVKYAYQPAFVQQMGCISRDSIAIDPFISVLKKEFSLIEITGNESDIFAGKQALRRNFCLDIGQQYAEIRAGYTEYALQNIKKINADILTLTTVEDSGRAIRFFKDNNDKNQFSKQDFQILKRLIDNPNKTSSKCYEVIDKEGNTICLSLITSAMNRHVYTVSTVTEIGRNMRATFFLIDQFIQQHCGTNGAVFDFEGSNISGVARFFASFGATDRPYPFFRINNLPWALGLIKRYL